jgi:O-methyltransferase involved in polyketide biosynthesis
MARASVELEGVPETLLWTLYHRAGEARRTDAVLEDPKGVEVRDAIDFPFAERFGEASAGLSQWQALRARRFDVEVRRFLAEHPDGTVVALGEGLETQFWRVDNGRVRWLTVDLPETIAVRERLLPAGGRRSVIAASALDEDWLDAVDASRGVLVTAQGLLMYLERDEVHRLIAACARRLPGKALLLHAIPRWLGERSRQGRLGSPDGYQPPPWTWGLDAGERHAIEALPGVAGLQRLRLPRGRGVLKGWMLPLAGGIPGVRDALFSIVLARFTP